MDPVFQELSLGVSPQDPEHARDRLEKSAVMLGFNVFPGLRAGSVKFPVVKAQPLPMTEPRCMSLAVVVRRTFSSSEYDFLRADLTRFEWVDLPSPEITFASAS